MNEKNGSQYYIRPNGGAKVGGFIACEFAEVSGKYHLFFYLDEVCEKPNIEQLALKVVSILKKHKAYDVSYNLNSFDNTRKELGKTREIIFIKIDFSLRSIQNMNCDAC